MQTSTYAQLVIYSNNTPPSLPPPSPKVKAFDRARGRTKQHLTMSHETTTSARGDEQQHAIGHAAALLWRGARVRGGGSSTRGAPVLLEMIHVRAHAYKAHIAPNPCQHNTPQKPAWLSVDGAVAWACGLDEPKYLWALDRAAARAAEVCDVDDGGDGKGLVGCPTPWPRTSRRGACAQLKSSPPPHFATTLSWQFIRSSAPVLALLMGRSTRRRRCTACTTRKTRPHRGHGCGQRRQPIAVDQIKFGTCARCALQPPTYQTR